MRMDIFKKIFVQIICYYYCFQFQQQNMRTDFVTIEPEIVQFARDNHQTIKIINNTNNTLSNFFFCLYNTEKFAFQPDSFTLAPNEHKLVTINLRLKSTRSVAKEFAYLKSNQVNKRITLLINSFQSPQIKNKANEEGVEDQNTLSSRDYKDIQTHAIQKIIKQKEAYISMLQKQKQVNRSINFRTQQSAEKAKIFKKQVQQLQVKIIVSQNEKKSILKENLILQQKFEQYRKYCESDLKNYEKLKKQVDYKNEQISKLHEQLQYYEDQGKKFIKKVEQKQQKMKEMQIAHKKILEQSKKQAQKRINQLQQRLEQQKASFQQSSRYSQDRMRQLQKKLEEGSSSKQKTFYLQKQLKRKQQDIKNLTQAIETQRHSLKELNEQKKKLIKYELLNENMTQKNNELISRIKELELNNYNLKEQIYVYKTKVAQVDISSDKMSQYLQIALQSCRNENDVLKKNKMQLQKSLDEFLKINRQNHDNNRSLNDQISKYKEEINLLMQIKQNLQKRNEQIKQEHHIIVMQLKTQNIELIQRLSYGDISKRQEIIKNLQQQLIIKDSFIDKQKQEFSLLLKKLEEMQQDNITLIEKVKKYKKQAKKQLKSINQTAITQLTKEQQNKKKMAQRIMELQEVIINYSCDKNRAQSKDQPFRTRQQINDNEFRAQQRQRALSRVVGIKDQRRQINKSNKAYSQTTNQQYTSQLIQLRELKQFIDSQQARFNRLFDLQSQDRFDESTLNAESRAIFKAVKLFKNIQNKFRQLKGQGQIDSLKQIQYLKGRIKELEPLKEQKEISSLNLNKTRQHHSQLLDFVREQMKTQYKKLNDTLKIWQQKYDLLKKKIYEEYRAKIIEVLNKKQKNNINQLQTILERFIQGMSNLSHKEAILHKQVKLKQNARKQNIQLKQKVNNLNHLLSNKKGYCTRDPIKLINNEMQIQWQESLKRQAEFLTLSAQYQRLKQQCQLLSEQLGEARQDYRRLQNEVDEKSHEILRLKKYQVEIQSNYQTQIQKQYELIQQNKKKIMQMTKTKKQTMKHSSKERQYNNLIQSMQKQKEVIRTLKEKEKMLEQILQESHRSQQKQRKKINQENRVIQTMRDLKQNNRELRAENNKLKEKLQKIQQQIQKKNVYLKNLKVDIEENRFRLQKKDEIQSQKLKEEIRFMTEQSKRAKDDNEKSKRKRQKQISELKNDIQRLRNENLINVKSLQSIIRALIDTIRKIYSRLKFIIKKRKGKDIQDNQHLFQISHGFDINALKIDEVFEKILIYIQQID